jgi:hypothetical protein
MNLYKLQFLKVFLIVVRSLLRPNAVPTLHGIPRGSRRKLKAQPVDVEALKNGLDSLKKIR